MDDLTDALRAGGDDAVDPAAASERAARRLAAAADERGLLDVAYAIVDSPLGPLRAATTRRGLVMLAYGDAPLDDLLDRLAERVSPRILEAPARLDPVRRELDEYFEGRRRDFDLPIDWTLTRGYAQRGAAPHRRDPVRRGEHVRRDRRPRGQPARLAGGRQRPGIEPDADRGAVPPRPGAARAPSAGTPGASTASASC